MARTLRCFVTLGLSLLSAVPLAHAGSITSLGRAVTFDQFAVRWGVEQRFGTLDRPFATLGAGVGYASGFGSTAGSDDGMFTLQGLGRATLFLYVGRSSRLGLGLEAGPNWSYVPRQDVSPWTHAEVTLRWESMLRLPKRILPVP